MILVKLENEVPPFLEGVIVSCISYTEYIKDGHLVIDILLGPDDRVYIECCDDSQENRDIAIQQMIGLCALTPEERKALS